MRILCGTILAAAVGVAISTAAGAEKVPAVAIHSATTNGVEGAMALPTGEAVNVNVRKRSDDSLVVDVAAPDWVKIEVLNGVGPRWR